MYRGVTKVDYWISSRLLNGPTLWQVPISYIPDCLIFGPRVLLPDINPICLPSASSSSSSAIFTRRADLISRVSLPCTVFAAAIRCLPASVLGPVDLPPCMRQTCFPLSAGERHCILVRFDLAAHCRHRMRPPNVRNVVMGRSISIVGGKPSLMINIRITS